MRQSDDQTLPGKLDKHLLGQPETMSNEEAVYQLSNEEAVYQLLTLIEGL